MKRGTRGVGPAVDANGRKVRHGDLLVVPGSSRRWVVLGVTRGQWLGGVNVAGPGLHMFGGYWYRGGAPLATRRFGKVAPIEGRVVARCRSAYALRRHCL